MTTPLSIPADLRIHFVPAQPAYDAYNWMLPVYHRPEPVNARCPEVSGMYGSNNGILVVYDAVGDPFAASFRELERHGITPALTYDKLNSAGFRARHIYVCHSNDGGAWAKSMWPQAY
jgi:hypothetical protein